MLKISAFYLEKQKSFVPKKNVHHLSNRGFEKQNSRASARNYMVDEFLKSLILDLERKKTHSYR